MPTTETTVERKTTSKADVVEAEPLRSALAFVGETMIPGGSNLLKGDVRQAVIHAAGGLMARSLFGLPGMLVVASNSFVKATTGKHLHEHLAGSK